MDKIKLLIISVKNRINNVWDKLSGKFSFKKKNSILQGTLDKKLVFNLSKSYIPSPKQLKKIPQFLSVKEKRIIQTLVTVIFLCFCFWGVNFYFTHIKIVPKIAGNYTEGVVGSPQYINPLFSLDNDVDSDLVKLIFSGLLKYNSETKELDPDLCKSYEISEDQKTYTFYLRDNLFWHDGESLTVDDIIFTIELAKLEKVKSQIGEIFRGVIIEKINDSTIKFTLNEPFAPFLSMIDFGILPKHIWEDVNLNNINLAEYNLKPIGSGPYKIKTRTIDTAGNIKSYVLTINDKYYKNTPFVETLTFNFYSGYNEAVEALKTRSIEGLSFIPLAMEEELAEREHLQYFPLVMPQYMGIFFNQEKQEFLKDKNIREALTIAIPKQELVNNVLNSKANIIEGPIIKENWIINSTSTEFNINKSKELIEKSKFEKGEDDEFYKKEVTVDDEKQEKELSISITAVNSLKNSKILEQIKEYWKQIGVKTEINLVEVSEIKNHIEERNYEALLYGEITGLDPDPYPFWHSLQNQKLGLNLAGFSNKEVDELLEEARATNDEEIRKEKYQKFQEIIQEEKPAIFLYQPIYNYTIDKNIKGVKISTIINPSDRFANINKWYIKTKKEFNWK